MSTDNEMESKILVEPVALGAQTLLDTDLSSLALAHDNEQYGASDDFETLASIEAELESMNSEEVLSEETAHTVIEENVEPETIIPDVEMTDLSQEAMLVETPQLVVTTATDIGTNFFVEAKPTLAKTPITSAIPVSHSHMLHT